MAESDPPKDVHASRIKSVGTLVAAIAALIAALGAWFKPQDQSINKATYEELSKVLKELADAQDKNHDDIVALRGYVEGTVAKNSGPIPVTSAADGGATTATLLRDAGPAPIAFVQMPAPRTPPPPVHSQARPAPPEDFNSLAQKAKK
jgi:hypothetical protein